MTNAFSDLSFPGNIKEARSLGTTVVIGLIPSVIYSVGITVDNGTAANTLWTIAGFLGMVLSSLYFIAGGGEMVRRANKGKPLVRRVMMVILGLALMRLGIVQVLAFGQTLWHDGGLMQYTTLESGDKLPHTGIVLEFKVTPEESPYTYWEEQVTVIARYPDGTKSFVDLAWPNVQLTSNHEEEMIIRVCRLDAEDNRMSLLITRTGMSLHEMMIRGFFDPRFSIIWHALRPGCR